MTLDDALDIVKGHYGLLDSYVSAHGKMMYVVKAESELRAIPGVNSPKSGIALFASEVKELARGTTTIAELVKRKHPGLFA